MNFEPPQSLKKIEALLPTAFAETHVDYAHVPVGSSKVVQIFGSEV